ncbi:hypothetical protein WJX72_001566 [[Myrmecia] bisecta]|uniref:Uncharacterized protein n=1 Tax=[Myrmecia] bisecta TaxID=41462 RepID=A0AAW1P323_9CHLO
MEQTACHSLDDLEQPAAISLAVALQNQKKTNILLGKRQLVSTSSQIQAAAQDKTLSDMTPHNMDAKKTAARDKMYGNLRDVSPTLKALYNDGSSMRVQCDYERGQRTAYEHSLSAEDLEEAVALAR